MEVSRISPESGFITNPVNNFMIRLGQLKALVLAASSRSESAEKLVRRVYQLIGAGFGVEMGKRPELVRYIDLKLFQGRKRKPRYPDISVEKGPGGEHLVWTSGPLKGKSVESYTLECQDAYLADPSLPSNLGAVGRENVYELVNWGGWLGLISDRRRSIQSLGHVLRILTPKTEQTAFAGYNPRANPYKTLTQRLFFLYLLLLRDGEVLLRLYPKLLEMKRFDRMDAVNPFKDVLNEIRERLRGAGSMRYIQRMRELKNLTDTIEGERERRDRVGTRAITGMQRVSPRLENLVDLGILQNVSEDSLGLKMQYEYEVNPLTHKFVGLLGPHIGNLDSFLSTGFFKMSAELYGLTASMRTEHDVIFRYFVEAYKRFPRELGGKPITMLSLVAANDALLAGSDLFEIRDVERALGEISQQHAGKVRLSGGHIGGRLEFVVIDDDIVEKYKSA